MGVKICKYCGGEMDCRFVKNLRFTQCMCDGDKSVPVEIVIPDAVVYTCKKCGHIIANYTNIDESDRILFLIEELDE